MRKKGDYTYGDDAKKMLLSLLDQPKTIAELTKDMKSKYFAKIHYYTVKRLLEEIEQQGLVCSRKVGRTRIWWIG